MIEFPSWLEWLGVAVGMEWPHGNEDEMWAMAGDWRTAAQGLRDIVGDVEAAKSATLAAYPEGDGSDSMGKAFDAILHDSSKQKNSLPDLADFFDQVAESVEGGGTQIQYTKLMFYTTLAVTAAEIASVWIFPPAAPAAEAGIIVATRVGVRTMLRAALEAMEEKLASLIGARMAKFLLRHVVIGGVLGALQDYGIQQYQVFEGHRHGINWGETIVAGVSGAAGSAVGGPTAEAVEKNLLKGMSERLGDSLGAKATRVAAGTLSGTVNSVGAFAASVPTQFAVDVATGGWNTAVDDLKNTHVDWRMFTAGTAGGMLSGANHAVAERYYEVSKFWKTPNPPHMYIGSSPSGDMPSDGSTPLAVDRARGDGNVTPVADRAGGGSSRYHGPGTSNDGAGEAASAGAGPVRAGANDVGEGVQPEQGPAAPGSVADESVGAGVHSGVSGGSRDDAPAAEIAANNEGAHGVPSAGAQPEADGGVTTSAGTQSTISTTSPPESAGVAAAPVTGAPAAADGSGESGVGSPVAGDGARLAAAPQATGGDPRSPLGSAQSSPVGEARTPAVDASAARPAAGPAAEGTGRPNVSDGRGVRAADAPGGRAPVSEGVRARAGSDGVRSGEDPGVRTSRGAGERPAGAASNRDAAAQPVSGRARAAEEAGPRSDRATGRDPAEGERLDRGQPDDRASAGDGNRPSGVAEEDRAEAPLRQDGDTKDSGVEENPADGQGDPKFAGDRSRRASDVTDSEEQAREHREGDGEREGDHGVGERDSADRRAEDAEENPSGQKRDSEGADGGPRRDPAGEKGRHLDAPEASRKAETAEPGEDHVGQGHRTGAEDPSPREGDRERQEDGEDSDRDAEDGRDRQDGVGARRRGGGEPDGTAPQPDGSAERGRGHEESGERRTAADESGDGRDSRGDSGEGPVVAPAHESGQSPHPARSDRPTEHTALEENSTRGRCGELALRLIRRLGGSTRILDLERTVGMDGMSSEELQLAAGGKLIEFPGIAALGRRLMRMRDGAMILAVYHFAGADEHGVGAHAVVFAKEDGKIVVRDPSSGEVVDFPPETPGDLRGTYGIMFNHKGRPVHDLGLTPEQRRAALRQADVNRRFHRIVAHYVEQAQGAADSHTAESVNGPPNGLRYTGIGDSPDSAAAPDGANSGAGQDSWSVRAERSHTLSDSTRAELEPLLRHLAQAQAKYDHAREQIENLARELGIDPQDASDVALRAKVAHELQRQRDIQEEITLRDPERAAMQHYMEVERPAAHQRMRELNAMFRRMSSVGRELAEATAPLVAVRHSITEVVARDLILSEGGEIRGGAPEGNLVGRLPGDPPRVLVAGERPQDVIGPELRDNWHAQGVRIEYRMVAVDPDGTVRVTELERHINSVSEGRSEEPAAGASGKPEVAEQQENRSRTEPEGAEPVPGEPEEAGPEGAAARTAVQTADPGRTGESEKPAVPETRSRNTPEAAPATGPRHPVATRAGDHETSSRDDDSGASLKSPIAWERSRPPEARPNDSWTKHDAEQDHVPTTRRLKNALRDLVKATKRRAQAWDAALRAAQDAQLGHGRMHREVLQDKVSDAARNAAEDLAKRPALWRMDDDSLRAHADELGIDHDALSEGELRRQIRADLLRHRRALADLEDLRDNADALDDAAFHRRAQQLSIDEPTRHQVEQALREHAERQIRDAAARRATVKRELDGPRVGVRRLRELARDYGIDPDADRNTLVDRINKAAHADSDRISKRARTVIDRLDRFRVAQANESMRAKDAQSEAEREVLDAKAGPLGKGPRVYGDGVRKVRLTFGSGHTREVEGAGGRTEHLVGVGRTGDPNIHIEPGRRRALAEQGAESVYYQVRVADDGSVHVTEHHPDEVAVPRREEPMSRRPGDWDAGSETEHTPDSRSDRKALRKLAIQVGDLDKALGKNYKSIVDAARGLGIDASGMNRHELAHAVQELIAEHRARADEYFDRTTIPDSRMADFFRERRRIEARASDMESQGNALLQRLGIHEIGAVMREHKAAELAAKAARNVLRHSGGTSIGRDGLPVGADRADEEAGRLVAPGHDTPARLELVVPNGNPDHVLPPEVRERLLGHDGELRVRWVRVDGEGRVWLSDLTEPRGRELDAAGDERSANTERVEAFRDPDKFGGAEKFRDRPKADAGGSEQKSAGHSPHSRQDELDGLLRRRTEVVAAHEFWRSKLESRTTRVPGASAEDLTRDGWAATIARLTGERTGYSYEAPGMDTPSLSTREQVSEEELNRRQGPIDKLAEAAERYYDLTDQLSEIDQKIHHLEQLGAKHDVSETDSAHRAQSRLTRAYKAAIDRAKPLRRLYHELSERHEADPSRATPESLRALADAQEAVAKADNELDRMNDRRVGKGGGWHAAAERLGGREHLRRVTDNVYIDHGRTPDENGAGGRAPRIIVVAGRSEHGLDRGVENDRALADALSRHHAVTRLFERPETRVHYLEVAGEEGGNGYRVASLRAPKIERHSVPAELDADGNPTELTRVFGHGERPVLISGPMRGRDILHEAFGIRLEGTGQHRALPSRDREAALVGRDRNELTLPMEIIRWQRRSLTVDGEPTWHDVREGEAYGFDARKPELPPGTKLEKYGQKRVDGYLLPPKGWAPFGGEDKSHLPARSYEEKMPDGFSGAMAAEPFQNMVEPGLLRLLTGHWPEMSYEEILSLSEEGRAINWATQGPGPKPEPPIGWDEEAHHDMPFDGALYTIGKRWFQLYNLARKHPWILDRFYNHPEIGKWVLEHTRGLPNGAFDTKHPVLRLIPGVRSIRTFRGFHPPLDTEIQPPHPRYSVSDFSAPRDRQEMSFPKWDRMVERYARVRSWADGKYHEFAPDRTVSATPDEELGPGFRASARDAHDTLGHPSNADVREIVDALTRPGNPLLRPEDGGVAYADGLRLAHHDDGTPLTKAELGERILRIKNHLMRDRMWVFDARSPESPLVARQMDAMPHVVDAWNRLTGRGDGAGSAKPGKQDLVMLEHFWAEARYLDAHEDPAQGPVTWHDAEAHANLLGHRWIPGALTEHFVVRDGALVHPGELPAQSPERGGMPFLRDKRLPFARIPFAEAQVPVHDMWKSPATRNAERVIEVSRLRDWYGPLPGDPVEALRTVAMHAWTELGLEVTARDLNAVDPVLAAVVRAGTIELLGSASTRAERLEWARRLDEQPEIANLDALPGELGRLRAGVRSDLAEPGAGQLDTEGRPGELPGHAEPQRSPDPDSGVEPRRSPVDPDGENDTATEEFTVSSSPDALNLMNQPDAPNPPSPPGAPDAPSPPGAPDAPSPPDAPGADGTQSDPSADSAHGSKSLLPEESGKDESDTPDGSLGGAKMPREQNDSDAEQNAGAAESGAVEPPDAGSKPVLYAEPDPGAPAEAASAAETAEEYGDSDSGEGDVPEETSKPVEPERAGGADESAVAEPPESGPPDDGAARPARRRSDPWPYYGPRTPRIPIRHDFRWPDAPPGPGDIPGADLTPEPPEQGDHPKPLGPGGYDRVPRGQEPHGPQPPHDAGPETPQGARPGHSVPGRGADRHDHHEPEAGNHREPGAGHDHRHEVGRHHRHDPGGCQHHGGHEHDRCPECSEWPGFPGLPSPGSGANPPSLPDLPSLPGIPPLPDIAPPNERPEDDAPQGGSWQSGHRPDEAPNDRTPKAGDRDAPGAVGRGEPGSEGVPAVGPHRTPWLDPLGSPEGSGPTYPPGRQGYSNGHADSPPVPPGAPGVPGVPSVPAPSSAPNKRRNYIPRVGSGIGPGGNGGTTGGTEIFVRSHAGWGESAAFDPVTGVLRPVELALGGLAGVYGELGETPVVFYRCESGLSLRVGEHRIDLESPEAAALWEPVDERSARFAVAVGDRVVCDLRYPSEAAVTDLGLLIRDVLADPDRRGQIFAR